MSATSAVAADGHRRADQDIENESWEEALDTNTLATTIHGMEDALDQVANAVTRDEQMTAAIAALHYITGARYELDRLWHILASSDLFKPPGGEVL